MKGVLGLSLVCFIWRSLREREGKVGFLAENERDREQGVSFKREREMGFELY